LNDVDKTYVAYQLVLINFVCWQWKEKEK